MVNLSETYSHQRTSLEKIGNGLVLIHEGIPLSLKEFTVLSSQFGISYFETVTWPIFFDYFDLATDEIAFFASDNIPEILEFYQRCKENGLLEDPNSTYYGFTIDQFIKTRQKALTDPKKMPNAETILLDNWRADALLLNLWRMFSSNIEAAQFFTDILRNPHKPFLIINGHGGVVRKSSKKEWWIGEQFTSIGTLLINIFNLIGPNKYSAILLVSCNPAKLQPPKIKDGPIYYVEGGAGAMKENKVVKRLATI